MLETKPIRFFITVAEERHFSRAADRLCVTQSALSVQIINLEKQLGTRLLNRNKRSAVTLTVAGRLFLKEAKAALSSIEHAEKVGQRAGRGEIGHINIGYVGSTSFSGILPEILRRFHRQAPGVTVNLEEIATPRQFEQIATEHLDIGFLRPRPDPVSGVVTHIIHSEELYVALPSTHLLCDEDAIDINDLKNERFVAPQFDEPAGFEQQVAFILGEEVDDRSVHKTRDFLTAVTLVSSGYGVAIVPKCVRCLAIENVVFLPLLNNDAMAQLAVAYREDENSEAVLALIDVAKQMEILL